MARKKSNRRSYPARKKYSLNERISFHDKRVRKVFDNAKSAESAIKQFKNGKIAYSEGFNDAIVGSVQFSAMQKYGANLKAYERGVQAGNKALKRSREVKF